MEVIAVNSGNYSTKAKSKSREIVFRTKIQKNIDATKYIFANGVKYEVGEGEIDIDNLKHNSIAHTLCTLYALSILHTEYDICLVTCLPINQFKNKSIREKYGESLKGNYEVETEKGKDRFNIKEVIVYMEGAAGILTHSETFKNNIVSVIDIGGYNINALQFDKLHLVTGSEDDFDLGVYSINAKIAHDLNKTFNYHLKEYELNHILKHPTEEQNEIITKHYVSFINRLRNELKQRGYNLSLNQFLFTGGGSIDVEIQLKSEFTNCYIGSVFDTARGLYEVGVRKCNSV
ncbi:MAG: ParM/StbA family protein [Cellulosilyticum sp.]|nr:ParM/StbA family protein [Cellulosilyticum sp.]